MHKLALVVAWVVILNGLNGAEAQSTRELSGKARIPDKELARPGQYILVGDFEFASGFQESLAGDFNINGHTFVMNTGGGNSTSFTGVISGTGAFIWNGGGTGSWQTVASFLKGTRPNSFSGQLTILRGTLALAKPSGTTAVAGDLLLGGGGNQAIVRLDASHQIKDSARITITGPHEGRILSQGHDETVGPLVLKSYGYLNLGEGSSTLIFADSSNEAWDLSKTLTIKEWTEGKDTVVFRKPGLTEAQCARIGFLNPAGRPPGLYTARLLATGHLTPGERVVAINPPFDVSAAAVEARKKLYTPRGLAKLSGPGTPLKSGMRLAFFGDSLTWLNGYVQKIGDALAKGEGTEGMDIALLNHGINGGGVLSIRDGEDKKTHFGATVPRPFGVTIAADRADVAVIAIGINDIWWRATPEEVFEQALRDLVEQARRTATTPVLATLALYRELPDGRNPKDAACDRFADITRTVARDTGATLVDLRRAFIAYLQNNNAELRVDGTLKSVTTGVLTYDGVHPNPRGTELLAELIAQGLHDALSGDAR